MSTWVTPSTSAIAPRVPSPIGDTRAGSDMGTGEWVVSDASSYQQLPCPANLRARLTSCAPSGAVSVISNGIQSSTVADGPGVLPRLLPPLQ